MSAPDFAGRPQLSEDVARHVRQRIFEGRYAAGKYIRLEQFSIQS
jgi:DNA-binding GntR family transcriptional regulator